MLLARSDETENPRPLTPCLRPSNSWDSKPSWVAFSLTRRCVLASQSSERALISTVVDLLAGSVQVLGDSFYDKAEVADGSDRIGSFRPQ